MVSGWNCSGTSKQRKRFAARKDKLALSLEETRLSTGDTQSIEKLPVVSFEASGHSGVDCDANE